MENHKIKDEIKNMDDEKLFEELFGCFSCIHSSYPDELLEEIKLRFIKLKS